MGPLSASDGTCFMAFRSISAHQMLKCAVGLMIALVALLLSPFVVIILLEALANHRPPTLLGPYTEHGGWGDKTRITTLLNQWFPEGTDERLVQSIMLKHGFRLQKTSAALDCVPKGTETPPGSRLAPCPSPMKVLDYPWSEGLACGGSVTISWDADKAGKIANLAGYSSEACL